MKNRSINNSGVVKPFSLLDKLNPPHKHPRKGLNQSCSSGHYLPRKQVKSRRVGLAIKSDGLGQMNRLHLFALSAGAEKTITTPPTCHSTEKASRNHSGNGGTTGGKQGGNSCDRVHPLRLWVYVKKLCCHCMQVVLYLFMPNKASGTPQHHNTTASQKHQRQKGNTR